MWIEERDGVFEETGSQRGRRGFERMELLSFGVGEDRERGQAKKQRPKVLGQKD